MNPACFEATENLKILSPRCITCRSWHKPPMQDFRARPAEVSSNLNLARPKETTMIK
jgi:hypothetical protein